MGAAIWQQDQEAAGKGNAITLANLVLSRIICVIAESIATTTTATI
jgi:hypothetical protein